MKILFIDGHNFMFRARSGFQLGEYNVVYNFFRSLKPLIDKFGPNRVYFALEGHPKHRYQILPSYKANRRVVVDPNATPEELNEAAKKQKSDEDYRRQQNIIVSALQYFPISVMRHPDFEADDLIYNVVYNSSRAVEFIIVSTDTDFIQMLELPNVKLYNPVTKKFIEAPEIDYVAWKALRGDGSDNIPGIPGVGDQRAIELLNDPKLLEELFSDKDKAMQFNRNILLIKFPKWNMEEMAQVESSSPIRDWDAVAKLFKEWAFESMLKEPYWTKFKATFDALYG